MNANIRATGRFEIKSWDESSYNEIDGGATLARASVVEQYRGDIEGEGSTEYLMIHRTSNSSTFVGIERIVGRIGDRKGSFVVQTSGGFEGETARGVWRVVAGSGTGELTGLQGEGAFIARKGEQATVTLDYAFDG